MYRIIGADGREYGPISADQLRQWITEGRANSQTRVLLEGTTDWKTLSELPEFATAIPSAPPPPPMSMAGAAAPSTAALDQVNGPAIGLIIVGALYFLASTLSLLFQLVGASILAASQSQRDPFANMFSGPAGIFSALLGLLIGALILLGGIKMKKLESYGMVMTASIVAMLPCSVCCVVGLPIGIWSLVVLSKPEVKSAFH
jgi:hypothetical protein